MQGKFTGTYEAIFNKLTPQALGIDDTLYAANWKALHDSSVEIKVESGDIASYNPKLKTLYLKEHMITELWKHLKGDKVEQDVFADFISLITHELSHAKDSVIMGRELKDEGSTTGKAIVLNVIKTELRAWAHEAITREKLMPPNKKGTLLFTSWLLVTEAMVKNADTVKENAHKKESQGEKIVERNEVIDRYNRYVRRELGALSGDVDPKWFEENSAAVWNEMQRLQGQLKEQSVKMK